MFLTGIDGKNSNLSVRNADANVIFMDGNMDTVTVNMTKSDIDTTGKNLSQLNTWCTYTVNNDNVYTLKEVAVSTSRTSSTMTPMRPSMPRMWAAMALPSIRSTCP